MCDNEVNQKTEIPAEIWYNKFTTTKNTNSEEFLINIITQKARKRQAVVKAANQKGKSYASGKYGVSLSSVKRWSKRYDGTWRSLKKDLTDRIVTPKGIRKQKNNRFSNAFKGNFCTMVGGSL